MRLLAGQIELERGRLRVAEGHYLNVLARDAGNVHAHRDLAYIYNLQRRLPEMDEQFGALDDLNALAFAHLLHWSKVRNVVWNPLCDCELLARSLAADPGDRYTRLALAEGLQTLGRVDEAVRVLSVFPEADDEACARRALLALTSGDVERAGRILATGPADHPALACARGELALRRGHLVTAVHHLRRALAQRPDDVAVLSALATALRASGHAEAAKPYLEMQRRHTELTLLIAKAATPTGPDDPELPARLGAACESARRYLEARAWYHLAIARNLLDSQSQQAFFRLRGPVTTTGDAKNRVIDFPTAPRWSAGHRDAHTPRATGGG